MTLIAAGWRCCMNTRYTLGGKPVQCAFEEGHEQPCDYSDRCRSSIDGTQCALRSGHLERCEQGAPHYIPPATSPGVYEWRDTETGERITEPKGASGASS